MKNKNKKEKDSLKVSIKAVHGYLNPEKSLVLATVSWNDGPEKLNIRNCYVDDEGELQLRKGVALSEDEVDALTDLLKERRKHGLPKIAKDGKKAVDFAGIFESATDIVEHRDAGFTTEDGFICLRKRPGVKL